MAVGGPLMQQNEKDQAVSIAPMAYVTAVEARANTWNNVNNQDQTLSTWWGIPTGLKSAYTILGHFT